MYPLHHEFIIAGYRYQVTGYGMMMNLAIILGLALALRLGLRRGHDCIHFALVILIAIIAVIIGVHLPSVITILPQVWQSPTERWQVARSSCGGLILTVPVVWLVCRKLHLPVWQIADIGAPVVALVQAFGRMGCFLAGCCYGTTWDGPWAVVFTHPLAPASHIPLARHPLQLYEVAFLLVLLAVMLWWWPRLRHHGQIAVGYVVAYSLWRFVMEYWRADELRNILVPNLLSTTQAVSLVVASLALALWFYGRRRIHGHPSK